MGGVAIDGGEGCRAEEVFNVAVVESELLGFFGLSFDDDGLFGLLDWLFNAPSGFDPHVALVVSLCQEPLLST